MAEYSFGRLVLDGKEYRRDLIVLPDRVIDNWWRREGHSLCMEDVEAVVRAGVDVLVVGTGASGVMQVPAQVRRELAGKGVRVIAAPTAEAVRRFEELRRQGEKVAGAFHLTC